MRYDAAGSTNLLRSPCPQFESATLDLGKWGSFNLPPVGKGWFDTVFLDDNFRIDTNSRDDILICTAEEP